MNNLAAPAGQIEPPQIYAGKVSHVRVEKFIHRFIYRLWMLAVDLDDLDQFAARSRLFRHNHTGLISVHDRDHGPRDGTALRPWAEAILAAHGQEIFAARIRFMVIPRILGYAFNPIAFFFCYASDGTLGVVLHQVKNTFGDQVIYAIPVAPGTGTVRQVAAKSMHVSPFFDMKGQYDFTFSRPGPQFRLGIRYKASAPRLNVVMALRAIPVTDNALAVQLLRMPFMAFKVMAAIHWHALRLFLRGAMFHREPSTIHPPVIPGETS
jgi:DUF1365 family protein